MRDTWTVPQEEDLIARKQAGESDADIAQSVGRSFSSVNSKVSRLRSEGRLTKPNVPPSPHPKLTDAPKLSGDWLILPDLEAPFQHHEFINRVIDLAGVWGIDRAILAGDFMHFESLSKWGAAWEVNAPNPKQEALVDFMGSLKGEKKKEGIALLEDLGVVGESSSLSQEIGNAKAVARALGGYKEIVYIMGNHDERLVRTLQKTLSVVQLGDMLRVGENWTISPYYHCTVETEAGIFRITHPRGAGQNEARNLVNQHHCHIVTAHSHRWSQTRDQSANYWAIHAGHCVDEERLSYVQQRDAKRDTHALGAVILRGGYPHLLGEWTPWEQYKRM